MLSLEYVRKIDSLVKVLEILNSANIYKLKQEIDTNQETYLKFFGKYFYGGKKTDNERAMLLNEFKELKPLSNSSFKKYYRDIVRSNAKMETLISELRRGDIESTGMDKMLVISKQVEDYIFNMDENDNFSVENISELNGYLKEYIQIKNSLENLKKIYQSFSIDKQIPRSYKDFEIGFHTLDDSVESYSSRLLSLKLIYEILLRLHNVSEDNENKMIVLRAEKEATEYYKLAGLNNIITDLHFIFKEWIKDYSESESHDISHIVSFKIDAKIKSLVEKNQINTDTADKYYSVIKKSLRNIQLDKCVSIDLNNEHLVIDGNDFSSLKQITEEDIKNIIGEAKPPAPKTYNEVMAENKESSTLKKIESNLLTNASVQQIEEHSAEDLFQRGVTLMSLKRYSEALEYFDKALKLKPNFAEAYNYKAHVFIQMNRFAEAVKLTDQAISLKNNYREAYLNKGTALFMMGRHAEALIQYHKTVDIDKNYSEGYFNLGSCYMMIDGKKKEAIRAFTKALEITPDYPEALYNRACAYVSEKFFDECLRDLEKAVNLDKNFKNMLKLDNDFNPIHESQKFKSLIA